MDPRSFNVLARELANRTDPAANRTAISRAYYAAYNVAASLLEDMSCHVPQDGTSHKLVRERLSYSQDKDMRIAGHKLADLYNSRLEADYQLSKPQNQKDAISRVDIAEGLINTLDKMAKDKPRRQRALDSIRKRESRPVYRG
ncbi:MAG TPA: hypothetical protein VFI02_15705 [Armatimonadota bacterium]|nr:hypothetical protein [Armatimonadota bacterium]